MEGDGESRKSCQRCTGPAEAPFCASVVSIDSSQLGPSELLPTVSRAARCSLPRRECQQGLAFPSLRQKPQALRIHCAIPWLRQRPVMPLAAVQAAGPALAPPASPPMHALYRCAATLRPLQQRRLVTATAAAVAAATAAAPTTAAASAAIGHASPCQPQLQFDSWPGLHDWRAAGIDTRTVWGPKGPVAPSAAEADAGATAVLAAADATAASRSPPASLAEAARAVLLTADPQEKAALTFRAWRAYLAGALPVGAAAPLEGPPARPQAPQLVPPRRIPSMDASPLPKAVYMLHNLTHVVSLLTGALLLLLLLLWGLRRSKARGR